MIANHFPWLNSLSPVILIFLAAIFGFILNTVVVLTFLNITNYRINRKEIHIRNYRTLCEDVIRMFLFKEIDWEETLIRLADHKKPINRKILIEVLLSYNEHLRGDSESQIPEIFLKLNLNKDSIKSTRSRYSYKKVLGIRELTNLYPEGAIKLEKKFINSSNKSVATEAQASYIRLHPENPFDFLKHLTSHYTRWAQLTAFYLFRKYQLAVPSFVEYLDSDNEDVRNFSLRMIIFYQQLENAEAILNLISSRNETTRYLVIRAINDLRLYPGKQLIIDRYPDETQKNQAEIIKALKNIGSAEDFDFLMHVLETGSLTLKTEACRSLYFMTSECQGRLLLLSKGDDQNIGQFIAHVTDPRN